MLDLDWYKGKRVFVTGHTGFKGSWMCRVLQKAGAEVTGYALNPARDLGPRIAHALLPIKGKRDSDWSYSWIPVFGPLVGASLAACLYLLIY